MTSVVVFFPHGKEGSITFICFAIVVTVVQNSLKFESSLQDLRVCKVIFATSLPRSLGSAMYDFSCHCAEEFPALRRARINSQRFSFAMRPLKYELSFL